MENVMKYRVVTGKTEKVVEEVNELIKQGWQPWGSFQDAHSEDGFYGQQAMVRYGTPPRGGSN